MEISTDPDGTVYVGRHDGGSHIVLAPDGSVREEFGLGGRQEWIEAPEEPDEDEGTYDDGYADAIADAADAVRDLGRPRKLAPTAQAKAGA